MADAEFNTNFTEELEKEVAKEQATMTQEEQSKVEKSIEKEEIENPPAEQHQQSQVQREEVQDVAQPKRSRSSQSSEIDYKSKFPSWDSLPIVEQEEMKKNIAEFNGNVPIYKDQKDALPCVDKDCKFVGSNTNTCFPSTVFTCPVCGKVDQSS
jgi:hypothetical protein